MAWFKKNPKTGVIYEINSPKAKSKYYRKQVKKGAINKDGTPTSDYQRGKASGYIEALVDTNKYKSNKEKSFVYSYKELTSGISSSKRQIDDGIFARIDTDKFTRVSSQGEGTNYVKHDGKVYKVKGKGDISTSIHYYK